MGRQGQEWTQAKFERYLQEGRGEGSGKDYKPWHRVREVPSKGRSSRPPGCCDVNPLIDRVTHLLLIKFLAGSIKDFFSSNV